MQKLFSVAIVTAMFAVMALVLFEAAPSYAGYATTRPKTEAAEEKPAGPLPGRSDSALTHIAQMLGDGKYAQAISMLNDVLKRNPANVDALSYLGFANMQLGDLKGAEKHLRLAIKLDPRHLGANQHLGEVYALRGEVSRALDQVTVIRMICKTSCPESETLEAAINEAKKG